MTNKLCAIPLFLMLAFSLGLTTGCQKANETAGDVKEKAAKTTVKIKKEAAESVKVTAQEVKEKAAETAEDIKKEAAESVRRINNIGDPADKNKKVTAETVKRISIIGEPADKDEERAAETVQRINNIEEPANKNNKEVVENVRRITITGDTVYDDDEGAAENVRRITITGETADDEEEAMEIEPPVMTKTIPVPTLIAQRDHYSTESVTLKWNAVTSPYGNSVKYFVRLFNATVGFIYPRGWISGTSWTSTISSYCNYSWQVKARDNVYLEESKWSTADSFIVSDYCSAND